MPKGIKGSFKTYNCKHCGTQSKWGPSKKNIYCSIQCQAKDQKAQTLELWLSGNYTNKHGKFPIPAKEYIFEKQGSKCGICGITDWNGQPIVFQADHIDGDSSNLKPDNLQIICPNCHSQTETWGRKGVPLNKPKDDSRNQYRRTYYNLAKESA
jgi:endogenous inhibitor of DNA gyrase (YacG/DUF329 family)